MRATFPPSARLHDGRDYSRVFNRQQKAAGAHVVLLALPRRGPQARLGVVVSTKVGRTAVRRHQLKRWVRECFRLRLVHLAAGHDVVVLFRRDPPLEGHAALDAELLALVPKALAAVNAPRGRRPPPGRAP